MTTPLEHYDQILRAKPGDYVVATSYVAAMDEETGFMRQYVQGHRFRVRSIENDRLRCFDQHARRVSLGETTFKR